MTVAERHSYKRSQMLAFDCNSVGASRLERFLGLANRLRIPVTRCSGAIVEQSILENLVEKLHQKPNDDLRDVIFLCGGRLEEQVSFSAHILLEAGFDTRLVRDLIAVFDAEHTQFHDQRLAHSGALPITSRQLVYEWIATESDLAIRKELQYFLDWED